MSTRSLPFVTVTMMRLPAIITTTIVVDTITRVRVVV